MSSMHHGSSMSPSPIELQGHISITTRAPCRMLKSVSDIAKKEGLLIV